MDDMPLVSVIMSVYNENEKELRESIDSILKQSYSNIEFIIVCDNPNNVTVRHVLNSINDERVKIIINDKNLGLVKSLNIALKQVSGEYIARMDADDISLADRVENQLEYLLINDLDLVGGYVELINEKGDSFNRVMRAPSAHKRIVKYMKSGSCIFHPTWLVKKDVYFKLNGYRMIPHCEDYDFLLRAIKQGFKLGNVPRVELKYRIRESSISNSNRNSQFLVRMWIYDNYRNGTETSETDVNDYLKSDTYCKELKQLSEYSINKKIIKTGISVKTMKSFLLVITNPFFVVDMKEKIAIKLREI